MMHMGLKGSPSTFQRIMNSLVRELRSCTFAYVDDTVTCSEDFEDHIKDLRELFCRIQQFGMKLRLDKCVFAAHEVEYLGVLISQKGSRISPRRVDRIRKFPTPQDTRAVKSFLGAASYFRRYIENFAEIATPLTNLTSKNDKFEWREEHKKSFQQLKCKFASSPVLAAPIPGKPYEIHTDASTEAVAATLLQEYGEQKEFTP